MAAMSPATLYRYLPNPPTLLMFWTERTKDKLATLKQNAQDLPMQEHKKRGP